MTRVDLDSPEHAVCSGRLANLREKCEEWKARALAAELRAAKLEAGFRAELVSIGYTKKTADDIVAAAAPSASEPFSAKEMAEAEREADQIRAELGLTEDRTSEATPDAIVRRRTSWKCANPECDWKDEADYGDRWGSDPCPYCDGPTIELDVPRTDYALPPIERFDVDVEAYKHIDRFKNATSVWDEREALRELMVRAWNGGKLYEQERSRSETAISGSLKAEALRLLGAVHDRLYGERFRSIAAARSYEDLRNVTALIEALPSQTGSEGEEPKR